MTIKEYFKNLEKKYSSFSRSSVVKNKGAEKISNRSIFYESEFNVNRKIRDLRKCIII
jgi:hypothetical protein